MRARVLVAVVLLALAAALGYTVNAGTTHRLDAYAVHDLMPWRACPYHPQSAVDQLVAPLPAAFCRSRPPLYEPPAAGRAAFAVASSAAPAMVVAAVVALACLAPRRRRRALVVGLCGVGAATIAEVAGKLVVTRPPILRGIHGHLVSVSTTHSFPCGHTIRACIVVYLVVALRPAWASVAFVWFAGVQVALVATSGHTLTDLAGGLLVGVAIAAIMGRALRDRARAVPNPAPPPAAIEQTLV